jgi:TIR domain
MKRSSRATAQRIHYWADGQPYLSQYLCKALASCRATGGVEPIDAIVDQAVETFFREDTSHLPRIMEFVYDLNLLAYARKITGSTPARFSPGLNDKQFRLAHILGVIKADPQGRCRIRNRIYERALDELYGTVDGEGCRKPSSHEVLPPHQCDRDRLERIEDQRCTGERPESRGPSHPTIFVSYSHKDAKYKEEFERYMAPLRQYHYIDTWSDEDIPVSSDWRLEIEDAMERAGVAVVLVTSNFLNSNFCMDVELRRFVQARAERGLKLVAVVVSDCYWQAVPDLARYQLLPRRGTPIKSARNREQAWSKVVKEIGRILDIQLL